MARFGFGYGSATKNKAKGHVPLVTGAISHDGVTFTLASDRPAGQYANGDWWVLGPVTITSITPASTIINGQRSDGSNYTGRAIHGAMVNPGNRSFAVGGLVANNAGSPVQLTPGGTPQAFIPQGFDALTGSIVYSATYNASFNVDPGRTGTPLQVTTGSVVKCLSETIPANTSALGRSAPVRFVVLTVVDQIPVPGSIRPGMSRASKTSLVNVADFDLSVFQNLAPIAGAPSYEQALEYVSGTFNTFQPDSINSANMMPRIHPDYGREVGNRIHAALLALHLSSFSSHQKRVLLTHLATFVDDIVSRAEEGGLGFGSGGGNQWKKPALAIAAAMLKAKAPASWLEYCDAALRPMSWGEDAHHSIITELDLATPRLTADGRPRTPFTFMALGSAEWGNWSAINRTDAGMNMDLFYRDIMTGAFFPGLQAVELTEGAVALWNNPKVFLYAKTQWHRRSNPLPDTTNRIQPFPLAFSAAYRATDPSVPQIVEAVVKDNGWLIRFDKAMNELVAAPATGAFTIAVNGTPVTMATATVWRQNVGGTLASPVSGNDVITVSYTPGASPLRSVDAVNVPGFSGMAVNNRSDRVGGPNAAYPIVRFTPGVVRTLSGTNRLHTANTQQMTGALLKFRFDAAPPAASIIFGGSSGAVSLAVVLNANRTLEVRMQNSAAGIVARFSIPALTAGVGYDILWSVDLTQANVAAGMNCYVNGVLQTLSTTTYVSGGTIGWNVSNALRWNHTGNLSFEFGAFWLDPTSRVDLTNSANRSRFTSVTSGNLNILTRGDGITGSIPAQFHVGNAEQWNDGAGMNRGTGNKFFFTSGTASLISGSRWI